MIARRLLVRGRVQGVFYRAWTIEQARSLGLTGWVRNLESGDVEILAVGSGEAVEKLVAVCRKGPPSALVENVSVEEVEPEPLATFEKRPSV